MTKIKNLVLSVCPTAALKDEGARLALTLSRDQFSSAVIALVKDGGLRLGLLYASDERKASASFAIHAFLSDDANGGWLHVTTLLPEKDPTYPSLALSLMSAYWYERYIHDMFGITPVGHPDLRRLVHHENIPENTYPLRKDFAYDTKLPVAQVPYPMQHVAGDGVFEIPVGPIHAGIIEPGHFRFSVVGERIITLEGKLFFTHKGIEKLLEGKTPDAALPFIERISGDMAAAHAHAFCRAIEDVSRVDVESDSEITRAILVELERVTMHIHDLANIGGMGTGFALMSSRGFATKERMMRLSQQLTGNRFWRGMIVPGGVTRNFTDKELLKIVRVAKAAVSEIKEVSEIALSSEAFCERLDTTGVLKQETATAYGALGVAARGSGISYDARVGHAYGAYLGNNNDNESKSTVRVAVQKSGDIMARFMVRLSELDESLRLIVSFVERLENTHSDNEVSRSKKTVPHASGVGFAVVESWRGEIAASITLSGGVITRAVMRDPSFINWQLFGELAPGNIIPDFPLCNKSLNLSYSGTDM